MTKCHVCDGLEFLPNFMDAPDHPRCACGRPSVHESGECAIPHPPIPCPRCADIGFDESPRSKITDQQVIDAWRNEPFKGMSLEFNVPYKGTSLEFDNISARRREHGLDEEAWSLLSLVDATPYWFEIVRDEGVWRLFADDVVGPGSDSAEGRAQVLLVGHRFVDARNALEQE